MSSPPTSLFSLCRIETAKLDSLSFDVIVGCSTSSSVLLKVFIGALFVRSSFS